MSLFGRQVVVQFGQPGEKGRSYTGLRVRFRVDMNRGGSPNKALIDVWNLGDEAVALLQEPGVVVRLLAGYDVPRLLFAGDPIKNGVRSQRQGPDRILHVEAADGLRAYQTARVNVSFATETTLEQVLDEVATQLGLPLGSIRYESDLRFPHGITLVGAAREVLDRLAVATETEWSIRDGTLQIVGRDSDTGETAIRVSSAKGFRNLIGAPTRTDKGVEVTTLLDPSIRPGRVVQLESEQFNGLYVVRDVRFEGDSGERPWYTVFTARARVA